MTVTTRVPAYERTATATLPLTDSTGRTSVIGTLSNDKRESGPRRLVTKVVTGRYRSTNHRVVPARARSRSAGLSSTAEVLGLAGFRLREVCAIVVRSWCGSPFAVTGTVIMPTWLPL